MRSIFPGLAGAVATLAIAGCAPEEKEPSEVTLDPERMALLEISQMTPEEQRLLCEVARSQGREGVMRLPRVEGEASLRIAEAIADHAVEKC